MRRLSLAVLCFLLLAACQKKSDVAVKVLIGGTAIVSPGAAPIDDSIIIIAGTKIREVGARKDVPVPQASDRTDLTGEWVVPAEGSSITPGQPANLLILKHAPNGNTSDASALVVNGEWKMPGKL